MWKQIIYNDQKLPYIISDRGAVTSLNYNHTKKLKRIKPYIDDDGYYRVILRINKKSKHFGIHQLVARMFLSDSYAPGLVVNHIDGDKKNNHVENLEYVTIQENEKHAKLNGLKASGERNSLCRYSDELVTKIADMISFGVKPIKIARELNIPVTYVYQIKQGNFRRNVVSQYTFFNE